MSEPSRIHQQAGPAIGFFVGHQREMSTLQAALADAQSGQGQLVMLVGEPGIGKTATAMEFTEFALSQGAKVLWGRCYESIGMPSYWPWIQAIRSYVREQSPEQLRKEMGFGAGDIAEMVPEVAERLPDLESSPGLDNPEQARVRLFDSITTFLERASQAQPLVLILDNLHWADRPSLLLLEFLAQELGSGRLLVIGTYRDEEISGDHPLFQTLGELTKIQHFRRIPLRGLTQEDVGSLIELIAGVTPEQGLVEAVYRQTQGNPLFVTEVVRLLVQEGVVGKGSEAAPAQGTWDSWTLRIPDGVREAIGRRLHRLSAGCNQVLTVGSIIGREFSLNHLEQLIPAFSGADLLELLEEALTTRIIEEVPQAVGRYQFTHVLVQETLASALSATRRARLHRDIGEALEGLYADDLEAHAAELAHHFAQVEPGLVDEKFVGYCLMAGEQALAGYAYEDAAAHFQRGLVAKERKPMDREKADLLYGLGRAQGATGHVQDAWDCMGRAFDHYMEAADVAEAVAVAKYPLLFISGLPQVTHLVTRALTVVPPGSLDAGYLLSRYGLLLNLETGDYNRAQEALDQAAAIAHREGDAGLEIRSLSSSADVDWYQMRGRQVLEKSLRAIELARRVNDPHAEAWPRFLAGFVLLASGDPTGAGNQAGEMLARVETLRDRSLGAQACLINMHVYRLVGDWAASRELCDRGLALEPKHPWLLGLRAILEYEVGDFTLGESYLERALDVMRETAPGPNESEYQVPAWAIPVINRISGREDRLDLSQQAARVVLSSPSCTLRLSSLRFGQALIPVQQIDVHEAERQYKDLAPLRESVMTGDPLTVGMATLDRVLGLLSATMGQFDQATVHFEDALTFCRKAGYLPELAWTYCDYADCLLARAQSKTTVGAGLKPAPPGEDLRKVALLVQEGTGIAADLGMKPLMARLAVLNQRISPQAAPPPEHPAGLTHRELEVLQLIATGKGNRDIADELVLSVRTVERHVANIYGKIGSRGRAEATAFAFTHGLTSSTPD